MYHKLTDYVKSRYQTNVFPSCCFGDQYYKYEHHSINTLQISFIFYTLCITTCFIDARHGFNICSILCPLDGVTGSAEQTCKQIHVFISLEKNMSCVHLYAYTEQNAVWCNMKARVVFLWCWFERNFKKIFDFKIKNNLFLINSKLPGMSHCTHVYTYVTLTFLNINISSHNPRNAATPVKSIFRYYLKKSKLTKFFRPADSSTVCRVDIICIELGCQADGKRSCFHITQHQNIIVRLKKYP